MARIEVKDFSNNKQLEEKTDSFKELNSIENYGLKDSLNCILMELEKITKELKKINQ